VAIGAGEFRGLPFSMQEAPEFAKAHPGRISFLVLIFYLIKYRYDLGKVISLLYNELLVSAIKK